MGEKVNRILCILPSQLWLPAAAAAFLPQSPLAWPLAPGKPSNSTNFTPAPTSALSLWITHSHYHPIKPLKAPAANSSPATHPALAPLRSEESEPKIILCLFAELVLSTYRFIYWLATRWRKVLVWIGQWDWNLFEQGHTHILNALSVIFNNVGMDLPICPSCLMVYSELQAREMKYMGSPCGLWRTTQL